MNFIQGLILTVVFIFILLFLQKVFLGRDGCTLRSKPICEKGNLTCEGGMWKCTCSDKCHLRYPHIPHPHRCDPTLMPKNCVRATCIDGEWKCRELPLQDIPIGMLYPLKRTCDAENKPDCDYPVCVNGEWKCLKNKEGGCNLTQKIVCMNEDEEPICVNGNWICTRDSLQNKINSQLNPKITLLLSSSMVNNSLKLMTTDDFSDLGLDEYMVPINIYKSQRFTGFKNKSGFEFLRSDARFHYNLSPVTVFLWNPKINRYPTIGIDLFFNLFNYDQSNPPGWNDIANIDLYMFDFDKKKIIMYTHVYVGTIISVNSNMGDGTHTSNSKKYVSSVSNPAPLSGYQWIDVSDTYSDIMRVGFCLRYSRYSINGDDPHAVNDTYVSLEEMNNNGDDFYMEIS
jgi:hypothetical protein